MAFEDVPAYSAWKMFSEAVKLLESGSAESAVKRLANIIKSKESSDIFIFSKQQQLSIEQHKNIVEKYTAFTTWFIGRFFYLLACERYSKIHEEIIEAQICLLSQIFKTQPHVYHALVKEYAKALNMLIEYHEKPISPTILKVFVPRECQLFDLFNLQLVFIEINSTGECIEMMNKTLHFFKYIVPKDILYFSCGKTTLQVLDGLLYLVSNGILFQEVLPIQIEILDKLVYHLTDFSYEILIKIKAICSIFEQIIYDFYNNKLQVENDKEFENLIVEYLKNCNNLKSELNDQIQRLSTFIIARSLTRNISDCRVPSNEVQIVCTENVKFPLQSDSNSELRSVYYVVQRTIEQKNIPILNCFKDYLTNCICHKFQENRSKVELRVYEEINEWINLFYVPILQDIKSLNCSNGKCDIQETFHFLNALGGILLEISIKFRNTYNNECTLVFFEEKEFFYETISQFIQHTKICPKMCIYQEFLVNILIMANAKHIDLFHIISYPLQIQLSLNLETNEFPVTIGGSNEQKLSALISSLYSYASKQKVENILTVAYMNRFLVFLSSGLISDINNSQVQKIVGLFTNLFLKIIEAKDYSSIGKAIECLPHILLICKDPTQILSSIYLPLLLTSNRTIQTKVLEVLPNIICTSSNSYIKVIHKDTVEICCVKCHMKKKDVDSNDVHLFLKEHYDYEVFGIIFSKNKVDLSLISKAILKNILKYLANGSAELKMDALAILPYAASHIPEFYSSTDVAYIWIEVAGDKNRDVRKRFAEIIHSTIQNGQENATAEEKNKILEIIFGTLLKLTKKSLQYSDDDLQGTLLMIIEELGLIKDSRITYECVKLLMYFIMIPTSYHSLVAVNKCFKIAKDEANKMSVYSQYKKEICEVIVHLCCVNLELVQYTLQESLSKVAMMLGFHGPKEFLSQESHWLLPFFIVKVVKKPKFIQLIEEIANAMDLEVSDLLCQKYGNIYLHIILEDIPEAEAKQCLAYLEQTTQLSGPVLRKRNFRVILNELLLNFHEKKEKTLSVLQLLATEDNENNTPSVPDYLQLQFLGILHCFDVKLISEYSKKDQVLHSLADLLRFMEPRHLIPLRFKIIAMLQTIPYKKYPNLACEIWDSYLRNCGVDSLGSQLATIFVSILPLMDYCPEKVNSIAKYLLIDNQHHLKDYIADLFFVNNHNINAPVMAVIRKYVKLANKVNLKDKISQSLKYLSHEAIEVRIHGLKKLKKYLEESREELDQMILGYNGIDPVIVELVDVLTLGCREKDEVLKLGCGEVFAELGAIEPSHLPRRYTEDNKSFTFFINEDGFIVSALNELIKASQMEKNTTNMDRFAIAIQEILKTYDISPGEKSSKHHLWELFPDVQKEVMLPLLSSRYKICQNESKKFVTPIYNSAHGSTFNSWLYNWACSLISTLPANKKDLLQMCLPSMKHYNKILMHFLPYVVLHSILEGSDGSDEKAFLEFNTVIKSFNDEVSIDEKLLMTGCLALPGTMATTQHITPVKQKQTECTKVVFLLLDFLDRWKREWQWLYEQNGQTDSNYIKISTFLDRFNKLQLAKCNYQCGEYPRALMCLEDYITNNPDEMSEQLPFLAEIYAQLEEPDGVSAMEKLQKTDPSLEQTLLTLEVSGKLADAAACYEHMPRPLKLQNIQGLFQCYLDLDKANTALHFAQGVLDMRPEFSNVLIEMQAEPLWRLGQYDELKDLLKEMGETHKNTWGVQIGKALLHIKEGDRDSFNAVLEVAKRQQVEAFGAASLEEGAYQHGYSYITKLHCLNELQQAEKTISELLLKPNDRNHAELLMKKLMTEWELRAKVVQESVRIIEPLFCLRRVVLELGKSIVKEKASQAVQFFDNLLGECWLQSAKTASRAGVYQQAYTYILDAEQYSPPRLFLEKAKLHWLRQENEQMLTTLRRGLQVFIPENTPSQQAVQIIANLSEEQKKIVAEGRLLIATYNNTVCSVDTDVNLSQYKAAYDVFKEWEKSLVCLAQYYDKIFQNYSGEDRDVRGSDIQLLMMNYFGKSLQYGTKYIYQSIPRLLSIWFDYGTRLLEVTSSSVKDERKNTLLKMTKVVDHYLEKLPAYIFLTAFSQIISRICHPQKEVYAELKSIIIKLMQHYPQQCLWMIISVIKSSYQVRSKRCAEILCDPRLKTSSMSKLVKDFTVLAEKLIELCNKEIPSDVPSISVSNLLRTLPRLLSKEDFSEIMMPTHKFRKLILPNPDFKTSEHNPFPNNYAYIAGIEDELHVLQSLQRPRKITLRGSDGKKYIFMLKPKDDLRKDFRLMEFNDTVNLLLMRKPEARQRRLNIRIYSVAPLNEECGLIEWVPNLVGLRPVMMSLFKQKGLGMKNKEIREYQANLKDPLAKKREIFTKIFLARHPPILGEWFRKTFPDAQTWLTARTAYIRTTAVMSIAGYILGLGDRHGENISLDSTCGDVVHVDFNCLFNKGESFEWPEKVPFRLTQNMVSAMGPLGVEGIFRKSCECTLKVLRSNSNTLMSIVTPFVYDPLVSWPRNVPATSIANAEKTNEQAVEHIKNINLRLQGIIKTKNRSLSIPLSIEGQTDILINEALSIDNLCQMYIGWGPYL